MKNLNEMKNSKDSRIERGDLFFLKLLSALFL